MPENPNDSSNFNQFSAEWFDPEDVLKAITEQKQTQTDPFNNLDKIEAALREHPDVQDVQLVVLDAHDNDDPQQDDSQKKHIVAYLEVKQGRCSIIHGYLRHELPNKMAIAYQNKYEMERMYKEIFIERVYLQYGITLEDGACVFDVGANLGIFTLLTQQLYPNARVFSFEPSPPIFEILQINTSLYAPNAKLFNQGISKEKKKASLTFFPWATGASGYYTNAEQTAEDAKRHMLHFHQTSDSEKELTRLKEQVDNVLNEAFDGVAYETELTSISDVMQETDVEKIDLLKINAEKSEWDILQGIRDEDYPKIRQIVIAVQIHNAETDQASAQRMMDFLEDKGYYVVLEQPADFVGSSEYILYAARTPLSKDFVMKAPALPMLETSMINKDELEGFLKGNIPPNWLPSVFVFLSELPRTATGEIALDSLPKPNLENTAAAGTYTPPRTPTEEKLAVIWAELLGHKRVGIHDDFFELGGHSLSATQLLSRVCETFSVDIPMRVFFTNLSGRVTIAELARTVEESKLEQVDEEDISSALEMLDEMSEEEIERYLRENADEE